MARISFGEGEEDEEEEEMVPVTIDPGTLECFICYGPLRGPLHQCENGHVACSACRTEFPQNKCPTCSQPSDSSRYRFIEKIIESIKFPCCYSKYGCNKKLTYLEVSSHQETCIHAPCFCPMTSCSFSGFPEQVSTHFHAHHSSSDFQYGQQYSIYIDDKPCFALPIQNGVLFLLLNERHGLGNAFSVVCIRPSSMKSDFIYELMVNEGESSIQLKASAINVSKWEGVYPGNNFLLVPKNFYSSMPGDVIYVSIIKRENIHI